MKPLTNKQEKFAAEFVQSGDASAAYRSAYDCSRMKAETVHRNAHALAKNTKVATRVTLLRAQREEIARQEFNIEARDVLRMLTTSALYLPEDYIDANGGTKLLRDIPEHLRRLMQPKILRDGAVVFVPPDREAAIAQLGKVFDLTNVVHLNVTAENAADLAEIVEPMDVLRRFESFRTSMH